METLMKLFGSMMIFVYHCFDRIVINGYLSILSRPEQIVYFFKEALGKQCITKEVLSARTKGYTDWIESYAKKQQIPLEWAQSGVRKEDYVRPHLRKMEQKNRFGVYFILKSMEQGNTFRSVEPKYPTEDSNYRIIKKTRSRFTHFYFYIRDEKLGPMCIRVASFLPFPTTCYLNCHSYMERVLSNLGISFRKDDNAFLSADDPEAVQKAADSLTWEIISERLDYWLLIVGPKFSKRERDLMNLRRFYAIAQIEYCQNFIFRQNFPIRKLFRRSCELGLFTLTADKISNIFGTRITRKFDGKLQVVQERIDQAHHMLRAYFKNSFVKQYEKFRTFFRMEICTNNTPDIRVKKSLVNLPLIRQRSIEILDRFAGLQANSLNAHFDFPLFQRLALPITQANTRIAGIKIQDTRMIRLMETIMHAGTCLAGWDCAFLHRNIVAAYELPEYTLNQLRYDLRKMKAHGLVERAGKHYSYRLTAKGARVVALFVLFHKRVCGPLANSLFHYRADKTHVVDSNLEKAYHQADESIEKILELLAA
jgi:hypothetical protein